MNRIKIYLVALVSTLIGLVANAQTYAPVTVLNGGTNGVSAASSRTVNSTIDVRKQQNAPLLTSFSCGGTNAQLLVFTFHRSLDGSTWDTTSTYSWSVLCNGTNTVICGTNYALNGYGFLRLSTVETTNATVGITNLVFQYAVKQND